MSMIDPAARLLACARRVYETVKCPSVRPSVPSTDSSKAAGGFAAERPARGQEISIDSYGRRAAGAPCSSIRRRLSAAAAPQHGVQQQMRAVPR